MEHIILFLFFAGLANHIYQRWKSVQNAQEEERVDLVFREDKITDSPWYFDEIADTYDAIFALLVILALEEGEISSLKQEFIGKIRDDFLHLQNVFSADEVDIFIKDLTFDAIMENLQEDLRNTAFPVGGVCFHQQLSRLLQYCLEILKTKTFTERKDIIRLLIKFSYIGNIASRCQKLMIKKIASQLRLREDEIDLIFDTLDKEVGDLMRAYEVLGFSHIATFEEVKKRYKELAKVYHPDILMAKGLTSEEIEDAQDKMRSINEAYEIIKRSYNA